VPLLLVVGVALGAVSVGLVLAAVARTQLSRPVDPGERVAPAPVGTPAARVARADLPGDPAPRPPAGLVGVALVGGDLTVAGQVATPDGEPLAGASVELTRFVGTQSATVVLPTGPDGRFQLTGALGGRWRAAAWRAPDFPRGPSQVAFVGDSGLHEVALSVAAPAPPDVRLASSVGGDGSVTVSVSVALPVVDVAGRVTRPVPATGLVTLLWPAGYVGPASVLLSGGEASASASCDPSRSPGPGVVQVGFGAARSTLPLPGCAPPPPPDPDPPSPPTTTPPPDPDPPSPPTTTLPPDPDPPSPPTTVSPTLAPSGAVREVWR
jgi:hypothetical protein